MFDWKSKFSGEKEKKESSENLGLKELIEMSDGGKNLDAIPNDRCFMCMMEGTNNQPTWRFIDKVYCDKHKPQMDSLLRAQKPGKEPPWERI